MLSTQPLQQRTIFVEQQNGNESAGHRQQHQNESDAEIEALCVGISSTSEDARHEYLDKPPERTLPVNRPLPFEIIRKQAHAALITSTMSRATLTVSTSSTRWRKVVSRDWPMSCRMLATESCAMTFPL